MVRELIPGRRQLWHRASYDQQSRADSQDGLAIADTGCDLVQSIHMLQKSLLLFRHSHLPFTEIEKRPRYQSVIPGPHTPPEAAQASLTKTDLFLILKTSRSPSKAPAEIKRDSAAAFCSGFIPRTEDIHAR
jgi:hypothetical protein